MRTIEATVTDVEKLVDWFASRGIGSMLDCMDDDMSSKLWNSIRIAVRWARMRRLKDDYVVFVALANHFYSDDIDGPLDPKSIMGLFFESIFHAGCSVGYRKRLDEK